MKRRDMIKLLGTSLAVSPLSFAASPLLAEESKAQPKVVWVLLRGAMDSLHAVVPAFDPDLHRHRGSLSEPLSETMLTLARGFGLHPDLANMHEMYRNKELLPVVAVATPYRSRSHFDGQDLLESGQMPSRYDSGWLGRALQVSGREGLAVSHSLPISMRSSAKTGTWFPSRFRQAEDDFYHRLLQLYEQDSRLMERLEEGLQTRDMAGNAMNDRKKLNFAELANSAGLLLNGSGTPDAAMLEMGGWDTHNNQTPRLSKQFIELDRGLQALKQSLGATWKNTLVVVATEFGRTVRVNGTRGTDHGTGSALFLAGGAVKGGKVLGDWPGLAASDLYQGRDLQPTSDIRSWIGGALASHWGLSEADLATVFPGAEPADLS